MIQSVAYLTYGGGYLCLRHGKTEDTEAPVSEVPKDTYCQICGQLISGEPLSEEAEWEQKRPTNPPSGGRAFTPEEWAKMRPGQTYGSPIKRLFGDLPPTQEQEIREKALQMAMQLTKLRSGGFNADALVADATTIETWLNRPTEDAS